VLPVPEWVRPSAIAVADLSWLAYRRFLLADDAYDRAEADGMQLALDWVRGSLELGPATGRHPCPCTRAVAEAELWAAMALADGGGTLERDMRHACRRLGVDYWPPDFDIDLNTGEGIYLVLSWVTASDDGWCEGRRSPLELPVRNQDGSVDPGDARSLELLEQIEDTRRRAAEIITAAREFEAAGLGALTQPE
jgi:hypothetical protein